MSGVKNLRAMFENKGDDPSPPDRGRSPAGFASVSGGSGSESPRPLSTVRTNFVAIHEKDGRIGLRRNPSHESASPFRRPTSTDMETESISTTAGDDMPRASRRLFVDDPIPESPRSPMPANKTAPSNDAAKAKATSDESSRNKDNEFAEKQPSPIMASAEPPSKTSPGEPTMAIVSSAKSEPKAKDTEGKAAATRTTTTTRGGQTSTAAKTMTKSSSSAKLTTTTRPATNTTKRTETKPASKAQPTAKKESVAGTKQSTAIRRPAPVKVSQDTGFVKPKPKSPTKPMALPSSLMAPTASSVSKGGSAKPNTSRQAASLQPSAAARAPSRASAAGNSATRTVRRQPSTINSTSSSRPSIGPPPKKTGQDGQAQKNDPHVDESFLARMMRPTQSSSSKTTEKGPATPPRKSAPRPSTSTADASSRRGSSVKRQDKDKSPAGNVAVSSNVSEVEPSAVAENQQRAVHSPVQAPVVQEQTAESTSSKPDEAVSTAKSSFEASLSELKISDTNKKDAVAAIQEPTKGPVSEHVTMEEPAPKTAQAETVEEVAEVVEPAETTLDSGSISETPALPNEIPTDEAVSPAGPTSETLAPVRPVEDVIEEKALVEEDGRTTQAVIEEKEEALMDQMIPAQDVIPEETAVVATAEEVAALADAGDLGQNPAVPDAFPSNVEAGEVAKDAPEPFEVKDDPSAKTAKVEDVEAI